MRREASAMMVRQNLGELLNHVQFRGDSVVVTKDGKPVAALVDYELFERIRRMRDAFRRITDELAQVYAGVDPKTVEAEVREAVTAVRRKRRR